MLRMFKLSSIETVLETIFPVLLDHRPHHLGSESGCGKEGEKKTSSFKVDPSSSIELDKVC